MPELTFEAVDYAFVPGKPVLRGVSLSARSGRLTAVVGPNGAGKSTLLRLALGAITPAGGQVLLDGHPVASLRGEALRRRIAYVPQKVLVAFAFTTREVVELGCLGQGSAKAREAAATALAEVDLSHRRDDVFATLSAGQQQRAVIARALAQLRVTGAAPGPTRLLLADEPVSAMDPAHALSTLELLAACARSGIALVVVLHDLTLARRFADDVVVLDATGRVAGAGPAPLVLAPAVLDPVFGVRFAAVAADGLDTPALVATPARTVASGAQQERPST